LKINPSVFNENAHRNNEDDDEEKALDQTPNWPGMISQAREYAIHFSL
jgi:hypothetical protein